MTTNTPTQVPDAVIDPTDPGYDVTVLREHIRHLERRVIQLNAALQANAAAVEPVAWVRPSELGWVKGNHDMGVRLNCEIDEYHGFVAPLYEHPPVPAITEPVAEIVQATEVDDEYGALTHQRDVDYYQNDIEHLPVGTKLYAHPVPARAQEVTNVQMDLVRRYATSKTNDEIRAMFKETASSATKTDSQVSDAERYVAFKDAILAGPYSQLWNGLAHKAGDARLTGKEVDEIIDAALRAAQKG